MNVARVNIAMRTFLSQNSGLLNHAAISDSHVSRPRIDNKGHARIFTSHKSTRAGRKDQENSHPVEFQSGLFKVGLLGMLLKFDNNIRFWAFGC